jgi:hypothetical protein
VVTHLDEALPRYQFSERHSIEIDAPPERIYAAVRAVTAGEIFLFRTLTSIRRLGRPHAESILEAPPDAPILDVALRGGFFVLADDPPTEVVVGMYVIPPKRAVAAMNFRVDGRRLTTETRIHATDRAAFWRFGLYWIAIRAGSAFIRRMWLRAIRRRAIAETPP